jgi:hypothetical protein
MQCDQCGQPLDMVCLDCDSHLFQITIGHNAKAWLKGRWKLLEKASAKYKELRQTVIFNPIRGPLDLKRFSGKTARTQQSPISDTIWAISCYGFC